MLADGYLPDMERAKSFVKEFGKDACDSANGPDTSDMAFASDRSADSNSLTDVATAFEKYVQLAEITTLAELVQDDVGSEPMWFGAPPAGLVLNG